MDTTNPETLPAPHPAEVRAQRFGAIATRLKDEVHQILLEASREEVEYLYGLAEPYLVDGERIGTEDLQACKQDATRTNRERQVAGKILSRMFAETMGARAESEHWPFLSQEMHQIWRVFDGTVDYASPMEELIRVGKGADAYAHLAYLQYVGGLIYVAHYSDEHYDDLKSVRDFLRDNTPVEHPSSDDEQAASRADVEDAMDRLHLTPDQAQLPAIYAFMEYVQDNPLMESTRFRQAVVTVASRVLTPTA
jgi:hypothetical protein